MNSADRQGAKRHGQGRNEKEIGAAGEAWVGVTVLAWSGNVVPLAPFPLRKRTPLICVDQTLACAVAGRSFTFSFSLHCSASFALGAFGQVLGSALLRNTITPSVADRNSYSHTQNDADDCIQVYH
jgi:hypothetical protein